MKKTLLFVILAGLVGISTHTTQPANFDSISIKISGPARTMLAWAITTGSIYALGNIASRVIERAAHYRFNNEIDQLGIIDGKQGLIDTVLINHYALCNKGSFKQIGEIIRILPYKSAPTNRLPLPFVYHQECIHYYINALWWAQLWTIGQKKYHDIAQLRTLLKHIEEIISTDYRYTQELSQAIKTSSTTCA